MTIETWDLRTAKFGTSPAIRECTENDGSEQRKRFVNSADERAVPLKKLRHGRGMKFSFERIVA